MNPRLKTIMGIAIGAAGLGIILVAPITQRRVLNYGIDNYESHHLLFGNRLVRQEIQLRDTLLGIGAIVADLRRSQKITPVEVMFKDQSNQLLATAAIRPEEITDDTFAWAELPEPLIGEGKSAVIVEFAAPHATNQNPLGIRFDSGHTNDLALALQEKVPLWRYLLTNIHNSRDRVLIGYSLLVAAVIALAANIPRNIHRQPQRARLLKIVAISLLVVAALAGRLVILPYLQGVSGGDPYNYLAIAKKIANFENPFAGDKRLPGFPLLLLPAYLSSIHDTTYMRLVSVMSSGAILIALILLARALRLPWSVQFAAPALLAFQKFFLETSLRPEPYTFYTLLLLITLTLFFHLEKRWAQIAFGLTLGYAAMTRQEGFVLAAVLGILAVVHIIITIAWSRGWHGVWLRTSTVGSQDGATGAPVSARGATGETIRLLKQYVIAFLPALIVVLPFFIHNTLTFGNPIYTRYFEGERLNIVDSWPAFTDALAATWGIIGSLYKPSWDQLERLPFTDPLLLSGFAAALLWWLYHTFAPEKIRAHLLARALTTLLSIALLTTAFILALRSTGQLGQYTFRIIAGVLLASVVPFLFITRHRGLVVILVLITQTLVATWFHPFFKHYQQAWPILALMLATVLMIPSKTIRPRKIWHYGMSTFQHFAVLTPLALATLILLTPNRLVPHLDASNEQTAFDSVLSRAINVARSEPGPHGFDQYYQPALIYFDESSTASRYYNHSETNNPQKEFQWIRENNIQTLIVTNINQAFRKPNPAWQELAHFKAAGRNEQIFESWVYHIP